MNSYDLCDLPLDKAEEMADADRHAGVYTLIGGLVRHPDGRLFSQRRAATRKFGPGLWDNVGGHVEGNETLHETLAREIQEETGWNLEKILCIVAIRNWQDNRGRSREYIAICSVTGDLNNPVLEQDKVDQCAWIGQDNLSLLNEGRRDDLSQIEIYRHALSFHP